MKIEITTQFEKLYKKLPLLIRKKAEKQIDYFLLDPFYPSLNVEKLSPKDKNYWSLRIDKKYRIIFNYLNQETVVFVAVGEHDWIYKYTTRLWNQNI